MSINRFSFALNASENERFLVRKGVDMLAVLRALITRRQPLGLHFGDADEALQGGLVSVNPAFEELVFSTEGDPALLQKLIAAGSFGVETLLDSVRVLFIATNAEPYSHAGGGAFRARMPDSLARMQRREAVRVPPPKDKPAFCTIPVASGELRLQVTDVSVGGLGLLLPLSQGTLGQGKTINECKLELPEIGVMRCNLRMVYLKESLSGNAPQRVGCAFVDLPALSREQLKSYVTRTERLALASA